MLRTLALVFAAAAVLAAQTAPKTASAPAGKTASAKAPAKESRDDQPHIDKAKLEAYIRHLFVWPPPIEITIGEPQPGPMPGFYTVKIRGAQGNASQEETFYISKDGGKVIRGDVFDLAQNPFKENIDKLNTGLQPSFGKQGAPVVIVEFSDFECPFCREEAKVLRENLVKEYPTQVHFYYMNFPLESLHPWAKDAAMAGRCIYHQNADAFWTYHDWIFDHQDEITPDNLKSKILEAMNGKGVDTTQLSSCIDSKATEAEVEATRDLGHSLEINSTPVLFVNGRRMTGAIRWDDLKRVIDYEIDYQKTAKNAGEDCGCSVALPTPGVSNGASNGTLK